MQLSAKNDLGRINKYRTPSLSIRTDGKVYIHVGELLFMEKKLNAQQ
jgi:hypothetical protein